MELLLLLHLRLLHLRLLQLPLGGELKHCGSDSERPTRCWSLVHWGRQQHAARHSGNTHRLLLWPGHLQQLLLLLRLQQDGTRREPPLQQRWLGALVGNDAQARVIADLRCARLHFFRWTATKA